MARTPDVRPGPERARQPPGPFPVPRRVVVTSLVLLGVLALSSVLYLTFSSTPVKKREVLPVPAGRTVTYSVVDGSGLRTTQVVDLLRPDSARDRTFSVPAGAPDGTLGALLGGTQWTGDALLTLLADGSAQTVQPRAPVAAPVDPRPDLDIAVATGDAVRGGQDTILELPCTLYRTLDPLDGGPLALDTPTRSTTSCIGEDGTVLRDVLTVQGVVARTRTLVNILPLAALPTPVAAPAPDGAGPLAVRSGAPPAGYPGLPQTGPSGEAAVATVLTETFGALAGDRATGESVVRTYLDPAGHLTTLEVGRDLTGAAPPTPPEDLRAVTAGVTFAVLLQRAGTTYTVRVTTDGPREPLKKWLLTVR